jgi:hypothetical protein
MFFASVIAILFVVQDVWEIWRKLTFDTPALNILFVG